MTTLTNLTLENAADVIATIRVAGDQITCPICGRAVQASENAQTSPFWGHFFSAKHQLYRPLDPTMAQQLAPFITQVARAAKRAVKQAEHDQKRARAAAAVAELARQRATHKVSGQFLDSIVDEMMGLIQMMGPYYAQCDADADARAKIAEIRAITGEPITA